MSESWGAALLSIPILARTYGRRGWIRRGVHEIRRQRGWFKHEPTDLGVSAGRQTASVFRPVGDWSLVPESRKALALERGRRVVDGWYEAYGHDWRRLPADPTTWRTHFRTGFEFSIGPWWMIPLLSAGSDVKDVWEPARFGWVYDLVRAYAISGDEAFGRAFHDRLATWVDSNPPFRGVHWACGQEVSIRALAVLHAEEALPLPAGAEGAAARRMHALLAWSGERVADAIGYGLSQRNNHGISEAAGLVHIGLRLRGSHPQADNWLRDGQRFLDEQIRDQFAADGWYAQHSFTYARVALEQALLAQQVLGANGLSLSEAALDAIDRGVGLLVSLVDGASGYVPNHGANDGARIAPLSTAEHRDFRPLLTLAAIIRNTPLPEDVRPDTEVVNWFGGATLRRTNVRQDGVETGSSGWAVARIGGFFVFMRAGSYTHRPSHLDPLHIDVRINGVEVVTDAGTFAYNAPPPWKNGLTGAHVHNGPVLDDLEPAERGPRFLWYSWPLARLLQTEYEKDVAKFVAEVPGRARREIVITRSSVSVLDKVLDPSVSTIQVVWLLHPLRPPGCWIDASGTELIQAVDDQVDAWFSPTYGLRVATTAVRIRRHVRRNGPEIKTVIRPPDTQQATS